MLQYAVEWLGKTKKKYFAVRLKGLNKKKRAYTFRVDNSALAEEWYESFKKACSSVKSTTVDVGQVSRPTPLVHYSGARSSTLKVKKPLTEIPKLF